jgi:hypothetical protein
VYLNREAKSSFVSQIYKKSKENYCEYSTKTNHTNMGREIQCRNLQRTNMGIKEMMSSEGKIYAKGRPKNISPTGPLVTSIN